MLIQERQDQMTLVAGQLLFMNKDEAIQTDALIASERRIPIDKRLQLKK